MTVEICTDFQQYTPEWKAKRRGVPTASHFKNILSPVKLKLSDSRIPYACQLISEIGDPDYFTREDDYVSAAMKNGTRMEPEARDWYEFETGGAIQQVGFIFDGRFGASPDAIRVDRRGGCEVKSPLPKTHCTWLNDGGLPDEHKCQVHGCLIVSGFEYWDFVSYVKGFPPLRVRVVPDKFTEELRAAMEIFWPEFQEIKTRLNIKPADNTVPHHATITDEQALGDVFGGKPNH